MRLRLILTLVMLGCAVAAWRWIDLNDVQKQNSIPAQQGAVKPQAPASNPAKTFTPEDCRELIRQAVKELAADDTDDKAGKVKALIQSLGTNQNAGLVAIREFLNQNVDVYLTEGFEEKSGRITIAPSLRIALLDALQDWPGSENISIASAILQNPERALEVAIAARILELHAPGAHREEIIRAFQNLPDDEQEDPDFAGGTGQFLYSALFHFAAQELLPEAEKRALTNPTFSVQLITALESFSDAVRLQSMNRLLPGINVLEETPYGFSVAEIISYKHPDLQNTLRDIFAGLSPGGRQNYLQKLADYIPPPNPVDFFARDPSQIPHVNIAVEIQGRLEFLKAIAPECNTPDLQAARMSAQSKLESLPQTVPSPELQPSQIERKP